MCAGTAFAAEPTGYYSSCEGLCGQQLLKALHSTISSHTNVGYDGLWELYKTSDIRPEDGTIWDMYSTKHWSVGSKCGNYSGIGSCYNREHSFPKSWFGGKVAPMYSDAYHLYPTDGQINFYRGSLPYGECANGETWSNGSIKALGRRGNSTFAGYSDKVFEPDNEYKGDFARSYFYMAACYNDRISSWSSPMLAGNNYPVFSSWAVNLLMKWHRQDAVSTKELNRNEAVSERQHNRNPFIDHPELAEHIWGTKKSEPWYSTGSSKAVIASPVDGSEVDFGLMAVNTTATRTVRVATSGMTSPVKISVAGAGFTVSTTQLSATEANAGANITVSYRSATAGNGEGTLTISGDDNAKSTVSLTAETTDGLPVYDASEVTSSSFVIRWVNIDASNAEYTVDVRRNNTSISGYPLRVKASAQSHEVEGVEASTEYTFTVASASLTSRTVKVTTAAPTPMLRFLYDETLDFATVAGTPSDIAEVMIETENITDPIELTVDAPFELSNDRSTWSRQITLQPDEDRFYLRIYGEEPGRYNTTIEARTTGLFNDDVDVEGVITDGLFCETFDMESSLSSYNGGTYQGAVALWNVEAGNVFADDDKFNGGPSMRFKNNGVLEMLEDKKGGAGIISLDLRKWDNKSDGTVTVVAEYSTDGGNTWEEAGSATSEKAEFTHHSFTVNVKGDVRLRVRQIAGNRFNLDNVAMTDYSGSTASNMLEYHRWNAFSRNGELVVETNDGESVEVAVYGVDGMVWHNGLVDGTLTLSLPRGLYLVSSETFTRRVLVK